MHKSDKKFSSFNKISKLTSKIRALHIPIMNLPNIYMDSNIFYSIHPKVILFCNKLLIKWAAKKVLPSKNNHYQSFNQITNL